MKSTLHNDLHIVDAYFMLAVTLGTEQIRDVK